MINVYIVSGFLGSGKTTFIQKLLSEKKFEKVMLLENEFGEVGVDGSFFDSKLNVKEINNGCICCSLQGDFADALEEIEDMGVSDLIIEPSGVGKLSDIINVVKADSDYRIVSHICIVDVKTCKKYHINFKEYFNDQVIAANAIVLSHTDVADEETINNAIAIVNELNDHAALISRSINEYSIEELLNIIVSGGDIMPEVDEEECCCHYHHEEGECCGHHHHHHDDEEECCCHHHDDEDECHHDHEHHHHHEEDECCEHHHHNHDDEEECCCHHHDDEDECRHDHDHHHHHDDEVFKNMIIRPSHIYSKEELEAKFKDIPEDIIRIKGYVFGENNTMLYFSYVLNEYHVFEGTLKEGALVSIIGTSIDENYFKGLFNE